MAVSTNIETEQITNGNLKLKGNCSFEFPVVAVGLLLLFDKFSKILVV
jgi:hypothetical protein